MPRIHRANARHRVRKAVYQVSDHFNPKAHDHRSSETMTATTGYQTTRHRSEPIHRIESQTSKTEICNRAGIMMRRHPAPTGALRFRAVP